MKSTLWRCPVLIVALVAVLSLVGQAEAQRNRQQLGGQPNNQLGGHPNNQMGNQMGGQFGNQMGNPGGQMGNPRFDDDFGRPNVGGATNAQVEKATRSATGGMIAVGIVSLLIGVAILGCVGWLVAANNKHSSAASAAAGVARRRGRRD